MRRRFFFVSCAAKIRDLWSNKCLSWNAVKIPLQHSAVRRPEVNARSLSLFAPLLEPYPVPLTAPTTLPAYPSSPNPITATGASISSKDQPRPAASLQTTGWERREEKREGLWSMHCMTLYDCCTIRDLFTMFVNNMQTNTWCIYNILEVRLKSGPGVNHSTQIGFIWPYNTNKYELNVYWNKQHFTFYGWTIDVV